MRRVYLISALAILYSIAVLFFFPKWTVDDAYITFRYADNLANHNALTWNLGQDPIEGYTGVALPVMIAAFLKMGLNPVTISHIIGVLGYIITGIMIIWLLRQLGVQKTAQSIAGLLYTTLPFMYTNAFSGLETTLFLAGLSSSLVAFTYTLKSEPGKNYKSQLILGTLLLATSLVRPEGVAFSGAIMLGLFITLYKRDKKIPIKMIGHMTLVYLLPAITYFLWRYNYYGALLPNTFYAKNTTGFHLMHVKDIVHFLKLYFTAPLIAILFLLSIDPDTIRTRLLKNTQFNIIKTLFCSYAVFIIGVVILYSHSILVMNFSYRFFTFFVPFILVIIGLGIDKGWDLLQKEKVTAPFKYKFLIVIILALATFQGLIVTYRLKDEIKYASSYKATLKSQHLAAAAYIKANVPNSEWLMVLYDAGVIPYQTGFKTIDFGLLNDENIAHKRVFGPSQMTDYFFSFQPGVAVMTSKSPDTIIHDPTTDSIIADPRFKEYTLAKLFGPPDPRQKYFLHVFVRKDLLKK